MENKANEKLKVVIYDDGHTNVYENGLFVEGINELTLKIEAKVGSRNICYKIVEEDALYTIAKENNLVFTNEFLCKDEGKKEEKKENN